MSSGTAMTGRETWEDIGVSLSDASLVVAHPDDEALWFSSVLRRVPRVVICFCALPSDPVTTQGRLRALEKFPIAGVQSLGLTESETYGCADWSNPRPSDSGVEVRRRIHSTTEFSARRYSDNAAELRRQLKSRLAGSKVVFSHGPWGEYGHEEHVQVFRVVDALREELGFRLFVSNYVSPRSAALFSRYVSHLKGPSIAAPTDADLALQLMRLYQDNGCWTWSNDYAWPTFDYFVEWHGEDCATGLGNLVQQNVVQFGWQPHSSRAALFVHDARVLARRGRRWISKRVFRRGVG